MTGSRTPLRLVDALQAALAGEHAAVWASGRAAGELSGSRRRAPAELDAHRGARDALRDPDRGAGRRRPSRRQPPTWSRSR